MMFASIDSSKAYNPFRAPAEIAIQPYNRYCVIMVGRLSIHTRTSRIRLAT